MSTGNRFGVVAPLPGGLGSTVRGGNTGLGGWGETDSAWPIAAGTMTNPKPHASSQP